MHVTSAARGTPYSLVVVSNVADVSNITGSDEVWFNSGDGRYYLGASKSYTTTPVCTPVLEPNKPSIDFGLDMKVSAQPS